MIVDYACRCSLACQVCRCTIVWHATPDSVVHTAQPHCDNANHTLVLALTVALYCSIVEKLI